MISLTPTRAPNFEPWLLQHVEVMVLTWVFPKTVVFTPQIMNFNRVFHYFHHPFWGFSPYFWKHPHVCLAFFLFPLKFVESSRLDQRRIVCADDSCQKLEVPPVKFGKRRDCQQCMAWEYLIMSHRFGMLLNG